MDELEHEEPHAESYLSDQPNTLEKPTTPPPRKALFRSVFRAVLAPSLLFMVVLLVYFLSFAATTNQPENPIRLVTSFLLLLFGVICALWLAIGVIVLLLKISKRPKPQKSSRAGPAPKP